MKTIAHSLRRIVATSGLALVLVGSVLLAGCDGSSEGTAESYLKRAQELREKGDLRASVIELKNAVQNDPKNAEARALLGEIYLDLGDGPGAVKELERARELGGSSEELQLLLARGWLLSGDFQKVLDAIPADVGSSPHAVEWLVDRGAALFSLGRSADAIEAFNAAIAIKPASAAYAGLARVALFNGNEADAERHLQEGLGKFPDDAVLVELNGERMLRQRQFAEAEAAFIRAVERNRLRVPARIGLIRAKIGLGKFDDANKHLDELGSEAPKLLAVPLLRGLVALETKDYKTALQQAKTVLASDDKNLTAMLVAGAASYALEQNEQAHNYLNQYVYQVPNDQMARKLLGATKIRLGLGAEAYETLRASPSGTSEDKEYLSLLSTAAVLSGDVKGGLTYLEKAVTESPDDAAMRARLGMLRIAAGDTATAARDLDQAIEIKPELETTRDFEAAESALILGYLRERKFDEALEAARERQKKTPDNATWYVFEGVALLGKQQIDDAKAAFSKAIEVNPGRPDASLNLAQIELQAGQSDKAVALLNEVLVHNPDHLRTMYALADFEQRLGHKDAAVDWLNKAVKANPDAVEGYVRLARLYLGDNQPEKALSILKSVPESAKREAAFLAINGEAQLNAGQTAEAVDSMRQLVVFAPKSPEAQFLLARAYAGNQQAAESREALAKALELNPEYFPAKVALARMLIGTDELVEFGKMVTELATAYPNNAEVKELEGHLALQRNRPEAAAKLFTEAQAQLNVPRLALKTATAQWRAGDRPGTRKTLEQWLENNPEDVTTRLQLTAYYISDKQFDAARASLQKVLEIQPDNWIAHNDLAWLLYEDGKLDAALGHSEQAQTLAPENPEVLDTLGVIVLARGEADRAVPLLRKASEALPKRPEIGLHLAQALAKTGQKDEARTLLTGVLADGKPFDGRPEAEKLLKELGG